MSKLKERDDFGNRMKAYEAVETERRLDKMLPIYARIDGRAFSTFTRGMSKPFDWSMTKAMIETTRYLVGATHARIGYIQSDEISLVWLADSEESDIFFSGKIQKMVSVLASMAAAKFASVAPVGHGHKLPHFDARVIQLPSKEEAANMFLWRAMDARKNAISGLAQSMFSHRELQGKGQRDMLGMIGERAVDFDSYPPCFRLGTFLRRETVIRELTPEEIAEIPERHWPIGPVERSAVNVIDMPPFNAVANRVGVIFDGAAPILIAEEIAALRTLFDAKYEGEIEAANMRFTRSIGGLPATGNDQERRIMEMFGIGPDLTQDEIEARAKDDRVWTIHWESKLTGFRGCGTEKFTFSEARSICDDADREHPGFRHWPERVEDRELALVLVEEGRKTMTPEPTILAAPSGYRLMVEDRMIVEISKDDDFVRLESDPYEGVILVPPECLTALIDALERLKGR